MSLTDGIPVRARLFVEYIEDDHIPVRVVASLSSADGLCVGDLNCYVYVDLHSSYSAVYRSELRLGFPTRWYGPGRAGKFVRSGLAELERQMPDLLVAAEEEASANQMWVYLHIRFNPTAALGAVSAPPVSDGAFVPQLQQPQQLVSSRGGATATQR